MLVCLLVPGLALAETPPAIPLAVYGNVKIDNTPAPIGTIITVFNGASEVARTTTTELGKYFLEVPAANSGVNLAYKVNGLAATTKTAANPISQASDKIDLAVTTPTVSAPAPASGSTSGGGGGGGGGTSLNTTPTPAANPTPTVPGLPPTPPFTTPQVLGVKVSAAETQLNNILSDSSALWSENVETILANAGAAADKNKEKTTADKYISKLNGHKNLTPAQLNRLNWFITYSTATTKILGAGERAGVISSYLAAFGKLPKSESDWQDAIKIANGRWPAEKNSAAETKAKAAFKKIYLREANLSNANDNAAVTVMAYGLRPSARNLNSEKAAINSFKFIYKRAPAAAADWDAVRAIAYSGAKR